MQPFLITRVLQELHEPDTSTSRYTGYSLVLAAAITYTGIAITGLHSNQNLFRFITMFRGATVSLIYTQSLLLDPGSVQKSAAVSLMSTDVDRIAFCLEELNECWARLIELVIGILLLTRQLGWISVVPLLVVLRKYFDYTFPCIRPDCQQYLALVPR
jgi:ATP-binding cassette subfamily C (CFTR/MRP) protein 1